MYRTSIQMFTIPRHSPFIISYTTFRNTEGILLLKILTYSINIFIQNFATFIQETERYLVNTLQYNSNYTYHQVLALQICILLTQCTCVFCMTHTINSNYFPSE